MQGVKNADTLSGFFALNVAQQQNCVKYFTDFGAKKVAWNLQSWCVSSI